MADRPVTPISTTGTRGPIVPVQSTAQTSYDIASGSAPGFDWQQYLSGSYFANPANPAQALYFLQEAPTLTSFAANYALHGQGNAATYNLQDNNNQAGYELALLAYKQNAHNVDVGNQINQRQTNAGVFGKIVDGITSIFSPIKKIFGGLF